MAVVRPAVAGQFVLVSTAIGVLVHAFVTFDFSVLYVASNSNSALPTFYRVAALWGAHEGSLLLWAWILAAVDAGGRDVQPQPAGEFRQPRHGRARLRELRLPAVHARHLESVRAPPAGAGRRPRSEPGAAGSGARHPSAAPLHGLRRLRRGVCLRLRRDARGQARPGVGALDAALDHAGLVLSSRSASRSAAGGRTTSSAGAATGSGIRWRTPRSCPGWWARR